MLNIRPATVNDAPAIAHISIDTWRSAYAGIVPTDFLDTLSYAERSEQMRQHLASFSAEDGFLLVAEDAQGEGIGFASGGEYGADQPGCGEIYTLYVLPDRQGQGVGRRLLVESAQRLWQAGHNRLQIWTLAANPARGFYERLGGVVVQQRVKMIGGAILPEVAYSWGNLEALVAQAYPEVQKQCL
jgi:GNAT superfamily N-acetyltransferase